jgi:hypothetical protein
VPDDIDFESYLRYLYDRDISPAVQRHRLTRRPRLEHGYEFEYPLSRLARANAVLRLVDGTPDIYEFVRPAALTETLRDISQGVQAHSSIANELGFSEVLDSDFITIARRMTPEMLPPDEGELLRQLGFPDVAEAVPMMVYAAREHAEDTPTQYREVPPSRAMANVSERLEPAISDHERLESLEQELADLRRRDEESREEINRLRSEISSRRKPRRWWNAVRKIVQGTATSLADIAVAVGIGTTIAPPAWLTIVSVVSGVSTLTEAADELRRQ